MATIKQTKLEQGKNNTMVSTLTSGPSCPGFDSQRFQKKSEERIAAVAKVNQRRCLEESGQWLGKLIKPI